MVWFNSRPLHFRVPSQCINSYIICSLRLLSFTIFFPPTPSAPRSISHPIPFLSFSALFHASPPWPLFRSHKQFPPGPIPPFLPLPSSATPISLTNPLSQLGLAYSVIATILFLFPPVLPVDALNMNYAVVAFAIVLVVSVIQWWVDGRKNFRGPRVEVMDAMRKGEIVGEGDVSAGTGGVRGQ